MMIYGVNKVGKTRLIGGGKRTLIIRPPDDHTDSIEAGADAEELVLTEWSEMFETFTWLQQGAHREYDWVWLDTISLMQDRLIEDIMTDVLMRRPDRGEDKGGIQIPTYGPDQGEWKLNFDRIAKWVRDMTGIAKAGAFNFGITAHPFEWFDPTKDEEIWTPWIQGKNMIPKICGYMNIIAYMQKTEDEKKGTTQRVLLVDAPGFLGGDQLDCFPELKSGRHGIVEPTMAKIEAAIKKSPKRVGGSTAGTPKRKTKKRVAKKRRRAS
jgi:hypothetical protein